MANEIDQGIPWFTEEEYVNHAQMVVEKDGENWVKNLTTTQIRNLLSLSAAIYDKAEALENETLSQDIISDLNYLRIQFVYQSGRNRNVKNFVMDASLEELLKLTNSKPTVIRFCRYMEALVAYFKYNGGKDSK